MFGMCLSSEKEAEKRELKKNKADLALRRAEEIQRQRRNDALALRAAAEREKELDDGRSIHATSQARSSLEMGQGRGATRRVSNGPEAVPRPQRNRPPPLVHLMDDQPPPLQPPPLQFSAPPQGPVPPPNKLEQSRILELMRRDAATRRNSLSTSTKPPTRTPSPPPAAQSSVTKPSRLRGYKPWKIALLTVPIALLCILLIYDVPLSVAGLRDMVPSSPTLPLHLPDVHVGIPFNPVSTIVDGANLAWEDLMRCWGQLLSRIGSNANTNVVDSGANTDAVTKDDVTPVVDTIETAKLALHRVPPPTEPPAVAAAPREEEEVAPESIEREVVGSTISEEEEVVEPVVAVTETPVTPAVITPPTEPKEVILVTPTKEEVDVIPAPTTKEEVDVIPAPTTKEEVDVIPAPATKEEVDVIPAPATKEEVDVIPAPPTTSNMDAIPVATLVDTALQGAYSLLKYGIGNIVLAVLAAYAISKYGGRVATAKVDYRDEIEGQVDPTLVNPGASFELGDQNILDEDEEVQEDEEVVRDEPKLDIEFEVETDDNATETTPVDVVAEPIVVANAASPSPEPFLDDFVVAEKVSPPTSSRGSVDVTRVSSTQQTESPRATSGTQTLLDVPDVAISAREQALIERMDKLANELGSLGDQALRRRLESDIVQTDHCSDLTTELRGAVSALSSQLTQLKEERTARRSGPSQLRRPASAIIQRPMRFKTTKPTDVPPKTPTIETPTLKESTQTKTPEDEEVCRLKEALVIENRAKHDLMAQLEADQIVEEEVPIDINVEVSPTSPELANGDATSKGTPDGIWF